MRVVLVEKLTWKFSSEVKVSGISYLIVDARISATTLEFGFERVEQGKLLLCLILEDRILYRLLKISRGLFIRQL